MQAPELRVQQQGQVVWLARALQVATRLWSGAVVSPRRDEHLLADLRQQVRTSALCRRLLFCVDGLHGYVSVSRAVFRAPLDRGGRAGRAVLRPWEGILIAQVVKQSVQGPVVSVVRTVVQRTSQQVTTRLPHTQGGGVINTADIERLNATFRARGAGLVRRSQSLVHQTPTLQWGVYLVGTVYNVGTPHHSLRQPLWGGRARRRHWVSRTPAMAAGLTDHCWTVHELMTFHVPPPRWSPPKRNGRPSTETKHLIAQGGS